MGTEWTTEQKRVIALRNRSILVSAAAGSGKTAVLVERIMSKLTDPAHPVSIDRMLIMTFTRAAAGELKERIRNALESALNENPGNPVLQKQLMLVHMAQITTIDGFCGWILRNYFHLIGLDPGYRVADEGELELLKQDTLKKVIEEFHQENSPEFENMLECFCTGKSDESLKDHILRIYDKAMSSPDPEQWLADCAAGFDAQDSAGMLEKPWMRDLFRIAEADLRGMKEDMERAGALCLSVNGPFHFEEGIRDGLAMIDELLDLCLQKDYDGMVHLLASEKLPELSRKRPKDVDDDLKKADSGLVKHACKIAKKKDKVIIVAGLPDSYESEGFDRSDLSLPKAMNTLISKVAAVNPNVIVVLQAGSPVTMPWINNVKSVLMMYLSGCQGGKATFRLLTGQVNPSGHLAESFPLRAKDTPCYAYFANDLLQAQLLRFFWAV